MACECTICGYTNSGTGTTTASSRPTRKPPKFSVACDIVWAFTAYMMSQVRKGLPEWSGPSCLPVTVWAFTAYMEESAAWDVSSNGRVRLVE